MVLVLWNLCFYCGNGNVHWSGNVAELGNRNGKSEIARDPHGIGNWDCEVHG